MTDNTTQETTSAPTTDAEQTDAPQVEETNQEPQEGTERGNREAAKYRRQLRDTETERDNLAGRLEALQKQTVETLAGQHLDKPAGLWASGTELEDLIDSEGNVDPDKVKAAAVAAREELGLTRPRGLIIPNQGKTPETYSRKTDTFESAFGPSH